MVRLGLRLHLEQHRAILAHVSRWQPEEACGLLAGRGAQVERVYLVENARHSLTDYRMDPAQQVSAMLAIERAGLELIGIFHSHPAGPPRPSATDVDRAYYPEVVYLIVAPAGARGWLMRGFRIEAGQVNEVPVEVT